MSREWPPRRPNHRTAEPNQPLDLSDAAENYAKQIPEAVKRRDGFRLGDAVRRSKR